MRPLSHANVIQRQGDLAPALFAIPAEASSITGDQLKESVKRSRNEFNDLYKTFDMASLVTSMVQARTALAVVNGMSYVYLLEHLLARTFGGCIPTWRTSPAWWHEAVANLQLEHLGLRDVTASIITWNNYTTRILEYVVTRCSARHLPDTIAFELRNDAAKMVAGALGKLYQSPHDYVLK